MSVCDVKTAILSIVSTLSKSLNVFNKRNGKQRTNRVIKHTEGKGCRDGLTLQNSLRKRPLEIQDEYERSTKQLGTDFSIGDGIAQLSLSQTLLVLNTGLMNVIYAATSDNPQDRRRSRRQLLDLSETTGKDAVNALRQLRERLLAKGGTVIPLSLGANPSSAHSSIDHQEDGSSAAGSRISAKIHGSFPSAIQHGKPRRSATVRIAWVRPLKGKVSTSYERTTNAKSSNSCPKKDYQKPLLRIEDQAKPVAKRTNSAPSAVSRQHLTPFNDIEKGGTPTHAGEPKCFQIKTTTESTQEGARKDHGPANSPPVPPKIPLSSQCQLPPVPPRKPAAIISRRPVSTYSFLSDSTKVGEIPEHKLPPWTPPPEEPYAGLVSAQQLKKQKKHSIMFWRK